MIYNREFVDELLRNFYASFIEDESEWCNFAHLSPYGDVYRKWVYQKLYTLRYFPAYYLEYCVLAKKLRERLGVDCTPIQIVSLGCGICSDYYALRDNLEDVAFHYVGYDVSRWTMRELVPKKDEDTLIFRQINNDSLGPGYLENVDVFVFPKSIGDIARSDGLERLADAIAYTQKDRVFFLNSFVSGGTLEKSKDLPLFNVVHEALVKRGFSSEDDRTETYFEGKEFNIGLRKISPEFIYPDELMITCEREGSSWLCEDCNVIKQPVMKNRFMEYQLLEYTRT